MPIPMISGGRQVSDNRQSTYGSGLGTVYNYGSGNPYGPYAGLAKAPGLPGSGSSSGTGSSTSTSTSGKTPEAQTFLNSVMSGQALPYSPDRVNRLKSEAGDVNAAAEGALNEQINSNAAVGGASATDPSLTGARLNTMARRQTANQTAGRGIDEVAEGANFDAKLRAASMLEQSRMQSEALQAQMSQKAMSYMPQQYGGGGGRTGGNNFTGVPGTLEYQNANLGRFNTPSTPVHRTAADWRENARVNNLSDDAFDQEYEDFVLGTGSYA